MKSVEPLSSRAYQLAEAYQLGEPRAEYRDKLGPVGILAIMGIGIGGIAIAGGFLFVGTNALYIGSGGWVEIMVFVVLNIMQYFFLCFGGFFLLIGLGSLGILVAILWRGVSTSYLCQEGIVAATRKRVLWVARKEDVASFQLSMVAPKDTSGKASPVKKSHRFSYNIITRTDQFHSLPAELGEAFIAELIEERWPTMLEAYRSGKERDFGWLLVTREGLRLDTSNMTPWQKRNHKKNTSRALDVVRRFIVKQLERRNQGLKGTCVETGEHFITWNEIDMPWLDEQKCTLIIERKSLMEPWAVAPLHHIADMDLCLKLIKYALEEEAWKL